MRKVIRDDFDKFHDYNLFMPARTIYYGSMAEEWDGVEAGVDYISTSNLIKNLIILDNISQEPITIYMNTPGGDWYHGIALYDLIIGIRAPVTIVCLGWIMSMGTIILQAANKRVLLPNCGFMIHDGKEGYIGETKNFEAWAEEAKYTRKKMYQIYLHRIKQKHPRFTIAQVEKLCLHDRFLRPERAVELNLADMVA